MEYLTEYPSSDTSTPNLAQSLVETNEQTNGPLVVTNEPEFVSSTLEERLPNNESVPRHSSGAIRRRSVEEDLHEFDGEFAANLRAEDEEMEPAHLEAILISAESEAAVRTTERDRLKVEIKALGQVASEQIDRMEKAKARLAILQEFRIHAETRVCERAEREIRLEAEIEALRQIEATQDQRIEAAEAEVRRLNEQQARVQAAADAQRKAEAEARHIAALEAAQQADDEARRLAEKEEQELEHLETIRAKADAAAQERTEKEHQLNSQLLAFGNSAAEQLKRIETAEADLRVAEEEFRRFEAEALQRVEQVASRLAEMERRRQATAIDLANAEAEAQASLQEDAQRLAELELIRTQAEAEAEKRAEVERQLNADILTLRESEVSHLQRIEEAQVKVQQMLNEQTQLLQTAQEEEQRVAELELTRTRAAAGAEERAEVARQLNAEIEGLRDSEASDVQRIEEARSKVQQLLEEQTQMLQTAQEGEQRVAELESVRIQTETRSQRLRDEEQRLQAEIEALRQVESEQLNRIADAEVARATQEANLRVPEVKADQGVVDPQSDGDIAGESDAWPNDLQSETPAPETPTLWSIFEPGDQSNGNDGEELELLGDVGIESTFNDSEALSLESSTQDSATANVLEEGINISTAEASPVKSLPHRLGSEDPDEHASALEELGELDANTAFRLITDLFDDSSEAVRNAAARALYELSAERAEIFTRALREATPERRRHIALALDASGIAAESIDSLAGESREKTHEAFSMLFLMAKAGEVQSLFQTIEKHSNIHVRLSVIKLLTFTNRPDIIPALRSLAVRGALPIEVRSALMKSIYEMSSETRERSLSAA